MEYIRFKLLNVQELNATQMKRKKNDNKKLIKLPDFSEILSLCT